jgi:hypothetical protein
VAEKSSRFELAHPFLRVPQYKNVAALKTYLLQRLKLAPEQVGAEIYGVFKNKVPALDVAACVVVCELYAIDSASYWSDAVRVCCRWSPWTRRSPCWT